MKGAHESSLAKSRDDIGVVDVGEEEAEGDGDNIGTKWTNKKKEKKSNPTMLSLPLSIHVWLRVSTEF